MRYHNDPAIHALNQEIAARTAIAKQYDHEMIFNEDLGVSLCKHCGKWITTIIGGCTVRAHKAGAYARLKKGRG